MQIKKVAVDGFHSEGISQSGTECQLSIQWVSNLLEPNFSIKTTWCFMKAYAVIGHLTRIASWRQTPSLVGKERMAINQDGVKPMNWVIVNPIT